MKKTDFNEFCSRIENLYSRSLESLGSSDNDNDRRFYVGASASLGQVLAILKEYDR